MILLDTHVLVWLVDDPRRLSRSAANAIRRSAGELAVASITLFELAQLFATGRLRTSGTVESSVRDVVESAGAAVLELTVEVAAQATQFPDSFPGDPGDRLIAATALVEGLALVTADEQLQACEWLTTVW